ncbi:MAG: DUF4474 domain-containing protein [Acutalibacteraceae bacterium]
MKKYAVRAAAIMLALIIASSSVFAASAAALEELTGVKSPIIRAIEGFFAKSDGQEVQPEPSGEAEASPNALVVSSESMTVTVGKTVKMTASVSGVEEQPAINWKSTDTSVATVTADGVVKGIRAGKSAIVATAVVNGKTLTGEFVINVITRSNFVKDYLSKHQVLSYQYSYIDDYYYTNDKDCWQDNFGFGKFYDIVAPYILLEYDYVRVFFTYDNKDWMIQLWKGQYGLLFYGGEMGVYNKPHSDEEDTLFTMYGCPEKSDWLKMEMSLYHDEGGGNYVRQFTREYDDYWWCTGFKDGHLRQQEPADELRMIGRITLNNAEMTEMFTQGLIACGFSESESLSGLELDQFYVDGNDVHIKWQNISEAENTMPIKIGIGMLIGANIISFFIMILVFLGMMGMGAFLLFLL